MAKTPTVEPASGEPDPSMDDILASIRRILDDDQALKEPAPDVFVLDPSMMVEDDGKAPAVAASPAAAAIPPLPEVAPPSLVVPEKSAHTTPVIDELPHIPVPAGHDASALPETAPFGALDTASLVAPAAAAAAANSVGALVRTLAAERNTAVRSTGPTIEDLVREEIRPLMKSWLDQHLPTMVERLVRAEIERVVGRQAG